MQPAAVSGPEVSTGPGLQGVFGRPFVVLDDLLDLGGLDAIHDEICLALAQMPSGRSVRLRLPPELCRGVSGSRVTIEVLSRGAVADSLGPYELRC